MLALPTHIRVTENIFGDFDGCRQVFDVATRVMPIEMHIAVPAIMSLIAKRPRHVATRA